MRALGFLRLDTNNPTITRPVRILLTENTILAWVIVRVIVALFSKKKGFSFFKRNNNPNNNPSQNGMFYQQTGPPCGLLLGYCCLERKQLRSLSSQKILLLPEKCLPCGLLLGYCCLKHKQCVPRAF